MPSCGLKTGMALAKAWDVFKKVGENPVWRLAVVGVDETAEREEIRWDAIEMAEGRSFLHIVRASLSGCQ